MSDRSPDGKHRHPADERTSDQTTQSAGGLGNVRPGPGPELAEDVLNEDEGGRDERSRRSNSGDEEEPRSRQP